MLRAERLRRVGTYLAFVGLVATVVTLPSTAGVAEGPFDLLVSSAPDRSAYQRLDGTTQSSHIYVFTLPESGVSRVRFWVDDPERTGAPHQTENYVPYDLAGTAPDDTAYPFDTATLTDGTHTVTAVVETSTSTEVLHATFNINNHTPAIVAEPASLVFEHQPHAPPGPQSIALNTTDGTSAAFEAAVEAPWLAVSPAAGSSPAEVQVSVDASGLSAGTYTSRVLLSAPGFESDEVAVTLRVLRYSLLLSDSPDRSSPRALGQTEVSGDIFVFTDPDTDVHLVRFYVDDPSRAGLPYRTDDAAPYDLAGTLADGTAEGFDTSTLVDGDHTITAVVELTDATSVVLNATFRVTNGADVLTVSPGSVSIGGRAGETAAPVAIDVSASDGASPTVTATSDQPWLSASPASASVPASFSLTASAADLDTGTYSATVVFAASGYTPVDVPVTFNVSDGDCGSVPCSKIRVELPYVLDFESDHRRIKAGDGRGTGFTYVAPSSKGTGYVPSKLALDPTAGVLRVSTTAGIMARNINTQDNALSVGINAPNQVSVLSTTLLAPPSGSGKFEQAGLWFGNDEDNYVKLVLLSKSEGTVIEHSREVSGTPTNQQTQPLPVPPSAVRFEIRANPADRTVTGSYSVDGGTPVAVGTFVVPDEFFSFDAAGIDPRIGTRTFGGVFATHRLGAQSLTYTFDEFSVVAGDGTEPPPPPPPGISFTRKSFPVPNPTSMTWGPDDRLYVTELFGTIHALSFDTDWNLVSDEVITTIAPRLTLGITVDPLSTADDVRLWVSHSSPNVQGGLPNSSTVTLLTGSGFTQRTDVITGLPRAEANHAVNSLHFGPDGLLYIAVGGNTGAGAPNDESTEFGDMEEQPLSAAIVVADVRDPGFDGSCHNEESIYGPPPCDVQVWASGLRNIYDFVWHSNGYMYGPDNGLGVTGTFPPSPTPPCFGKGDPRPVSEGGHNPGAQPDWFHLIEQGGYYGHPNPYRDECVFFDGRYQGVSPMPNFRAPLANLGANRSSNGTIEYAANTFGGQLRGDILVANYSVGDNVVRVKLAADGRSVTSVTQLAGGFTDPLPLSQSPSGVIFVGEFGASRVTALVPSGDSGWWTTKAPMPTAVLDAGGAALGGRIYSVAGKTSSGPLSDVRVYDPVNDSWATAAPLPGAAVENPAVVALDGKLYAFGGSTDPFSGAVSNAAVYDPAANTWTPLAPMPTARGGATAQVLDGRIHVVGGMDGNGVSVAAVEVFDPATGEWTSGPSMSVRRDNPGSAVLDGKLYVFGGRTRNADGSGTFELTSVEAYDPATGAWTSRAPMPTGRRTMVVGTIGGRAQVIGGERRADGSAFDVNEEYDPVTDVWRTLTPIPTPRHGAAAGTIAGVLYVAGGGPMAGSSYTAVMEAFSFPSG